MADVLDVDVSWCGKQANEVLVKPVFQTEEMERFFDVRIDIKTKEQLALNTSLRGILRPSVGCGRTSTGEVINVYDKFIEVCDIKANLEQCAKSISSTFFSEMLKSGNDIFDLEGTEVETFIAGQVTDALKQDVWDVAWFGDTDSSEDFLTSCDGLWKRIFLSITEYGIERLYAFGNTLGDCEAVEAFRAITEGASDLLDQMPESEKYIAVTREVYDNYVACREDACCGDRSYDMLEQGKRTMYFRGIEVRKMSAWSRAIKAYGLGNKHRVLYTHNKNLVVGTDAISDTNTLDFYYVKHEKMNFIDVEMKMGTQIVYEELTAVGYGGV
jgi:hypothetical protein